MRVLPKDGNSLYLRPDIVALLEKGDIVCMQETWYSKQELDILNNLHPNFSGTGVPTTRTGLSGVTRQGGCYSLAEKAGSRN